MRWLDGTIGRMDMNLSKLQENSERQGSLACYSLWGCKESDTTQRLNNKYSSLCVTVIQTIWLILKICFFFSSGSLEFWHKLNRGRTTWLAPSKNCGLLDLATLPCQTFHTCFHFCCWKKLDVFCVTPLGEDFWKLKPGFKLCPFHFLSSFADFALSVFFQCKKSSSMSTTIS